MSNWDKIIGCFHYDDLYGTFHYSQKSKSFNPEEFFRDYLFYEEFVPGATYPSDPFIKQDDEPFAANRSYPIISLDEVRRRGYPDNVFTFTKHTVPIKVKGERAEKLRKFITARRIK